MVYAHAGPLPAPWNPGDTCAPGCCCRSHTTDRCRDRRSPDPSCRHRRNHRAQVDGLCHAGPLPAPWNPGDTLRARGAAADDVPLTGVGVNNRPICLAITVVIAEHESMVCTHAGPLPTPRYVIPQLRRGVDRASKKIPPAPAIVLVRCLRTVVDVPSGSESNGAPNTTRVRPAIRCP